MSEYKITALTKNDITDFPEVEKLFLQLYDYMSDKGLMLPLVVDGEKIWLESVKKTLDHLGKLIVAKKGNEIVGFAYGILRLSPEFTGLKKVGHCSHVFIKPEARASGVGKMLIQKLELWFKQNKVHSFEMQVTAGNVAGIKFWTDRGYKIELSQFRKSAEENS